MKITPKSIKAYFRSTMEIIVKLFRAIVICFLAINISIFVMWIFYITFFVDTTLPIATQDTLGSFYKHLYNFNF